MGTNVMNAEGGMSLKFPAFAKAMAGRQVASFKLPAVATGTQRTTNNE